LLTLQEQTYCLWSLHFACRNQQACLSACPSLHIETIYIQHLDYTAIQKASIDH
jgi:hypothetical protein